ncbi:hemolysin III family protein [uncultured Sulfitobacter sp.]|uniref:PAQR family membrane homeostasis protein TrhA n=1 Tax=uncultured Sulfitobacter sp. TaxID=191468 RepID=UPI0030DAE4DC
MTNTTFPSSNPRHRRADMAVHAFGLMLVLGAGSALITNATAQLGAAQIIAVWVYALCALASNLASWSYHFLPLHAQRVKLRRIDHAAIYPSIAGTFTPFFVQAGTPWTIFLLCLCWGLTVVAIWNKITNEQVKSRWSTASYLGLGAIGLCALPDLKTVPIETLWCVIAGAGAYVVGTAFYARKAMPMRYAIWHLWVNIGSILMFIGIWRAYFYPL